MDITEWIDFAFAYLEDWDFSPDKKVELVHNAANFIRDDLDYWSQKTIPENRDWRLVEN